MSCYEALAPLYDRLTEDVDYAAFADRYEKIFREDGGEFRLLLDLCCGTGSLSLELSKRGYELISVDASEDMLMEAREKCSALPVPPVFLQQNAAELDLYGTVDAAFSSLEALNYLSPDDLLQTFQRLRYFVRPGGLLLFDLRGGDFLRSLDGETFVDEDEGMLCLWRADFDEAAGALIYGMDLFTETSAGLWERQREEHVEYAHSIGFLKSGLEAAGFSAPVIEKSEGRLWCCARRL